MAGSVNKVILIGNLGADPEVRHTQDGRPIVNLRMATSESWRDKASGERKERTEWHRVVIFSEHLGRGRAVFEEGLEGLCRGPVADAEMAGPSGADRYSTEVVLQRFHRELTLLDGRHGAAAELASLPALPAETSDAQVRLAVEAAAPSTRSSTTKSRSRDEIPF